MAGMYLTSKLLQEEDDNSSSSLDTIGEDEDHELNNDRHILNLLLSVNFNPLTIILSSNYTGITVEILISHPTMA